MAITYLSSAKGVAAASDAAYTTGSFDTTGATLIVVGSSQYRFGSGSPTVSDSEGNSWQTLTQYGSSNNAGCIMFYCYNPTTSATHTVTVTPAGGDDNYGAVTAAAFSGTRITSSVYDTENGDYSASGTTIDDSSITPAESGELFVTSEGDLGDTDKTIDNGYTIVQQQHNGSMTSNYLAYKINSGGGALSPTWTDPSSGKRAMGHVAFKQAGGAAPAYIPKVIFIG